MRNIQYFKVWGTCIFIFFFYFLLGSGQVGEEIDGEMKTTDDFNSCRVYQVQLALTKACKAINS